MRKFIAALLWAFPLGVVAQVRPPATWDEFLTRIPAYPFAHIGDEIPVPLIDGWRSKAFTCPSTSGGGDFPSKDEEKNGQGTKDYPCDDGDATLFNGLLCASGEEAGCRAVANAQARARGAKAGQWYRSPNRRAMGLGACTNGEARVGTERYCRECINSFSPDQMLGLSLYLVVKHDTDAAQHWLDWIERNAKSTTLTHKPSGKKSTLPWPRLCDLDEPSNACIAISKKKKPGEVLGYHAGACFYLPTDIRDLAYIADKLEVDLPPVTARAAALSRATVSALAGGTPPLVLDQIAAEAGPDNFVLHLQAVRVLIRMIVRNPSLKYENLPPLPTSSSTIAAPWDEGISEDPILLHERAKSIASRQPWNAFYALLASGPTPAVRDLIASGCPKNGQELAERFEWLWNKTELLTARSSGWDCVFVAQLYNKMRVRKDLFKELAQRLDPVNKLLGDALAAMEFANRRDQEAEAAESAGLAALSSAQDAVANAAHEAVLRSTLAATAAAAAAAEAHAAGLRHAYRVYRRTHPPDPAQIAAIRAAEAASGAASSAHGAAQSQLDEFLSTLADARNKLDDEAKNQTQKALAEAHRVTRLVLAEQTKKLAQLRSDYGRVQQLLGMWEGKD